MKALVLGPGGIPATAWTAGLLAGLREAGVDLGTADRIIGTSAGAIVGALLASGDDPARLGAVAPRRNGRRPSPARMQEIITALQDPAAPPAERLCRAGRLGLAAEAAGEVDRESEVIARMAALIGAERWPERLVVPVVDVATGVPRILDASDPAPLATAVAAATAMPGTAPAVTIDGRRYMDGALRGGANEDLADGADVKIVVEPGAGGPFGGPPGEEPWRIVPDGPSRALLADPSDPGAWAAAFAAGREQAAADAPRVAAVWNV
ncbi:patatin-like phospholipase family protein [Actinomadura rayongensis]|uniref:Patatin-like phospholipase family protein n=1 Tax=Actinomadura rayongensis TaxID=1429076 RepID=A0A6I4WAY2_9ACTN|nr:patatin-like phospholipase family protein [Actinomadura rayongensis]MXQ66691.1 patatin-like phospholipase family protein [Actinomadura rayongensis]